MSEPTADEVGCQIILTTGEHVGECKGTCTEREQTIVQWTQEFLARIEALEAQVRELQDWVDGVERGALHAAMQDVTPETHGKTVRAPKANADNAKCACGMSASGQHDEVCPSHD